MIGIDSSVLIRYVTQDDERQAALASALLEQGLTPRQPGHVSMGALLEMIWVLGRSYRYSADQVRHVVARLVQVDHLIVAERDVVERAVTHANTGIADAIIHELGRKAGCDETVTFDRQFARLKGVRLLSD